MGGERREKDEEENGTKELTVRRNASGRLALIFIPHHLFHMEKEIKKKIVYMNNLNSLAWCLHKQKLTKIEIL